MLWTYDIYPKLQYWYHGCLRTQRNFMPEAVRILILAHSAARTVSLTLCMRF